MCDKESRLCSCPDCGKVPGVSLELEAILSPVGISRRQLGRFDLILNWQRGSRFDHWATPKGRSSNGEFGAGIEIHLCM